MIQLFNKTSSKISSIIVAFNAGQRVEKIGKFNAGLAHMLEHCIFKGTETRESLEIQEEVSMLGGYINAFTSHEIVAYYIEVPYENLEPAMELMSDIILNSTIPDGEFEKERNVVLEEEASSYDSVGSFMYKEFRSRFFKGYKSEPVIGTKESINNFTAQEVRDFYKRFCTRDNIYLSVSSNCTKKHAKGLMEKHFGKANGRVKKPKTFKRIDKYPAVGQTLELTRPEIEHTYVWMSFPFFLESEKKPSSSIMASVLGGGMDSRLFVEVREKRGLVYSIGCGSSQGETQGVFRVSFSTRDENVDEVIELVKQEIKKISTELITEKELIKTKNISRTSYYKTIEDGYTIAMSQINQKLFKSLGVEKYSQLLQDTTREDVLERAKEIFSVEPFLMICRGEKNEK